MGETDEQPRLTPLKPREWPETMRAALAALVPPNPRHPLPERRDDRPKGLNLLGTFARHPALTTAYHTFNGHVLFATTLGSRERELLVLRVAAVRRAEYEWAQHVVQALGAGLTGDEIARVADGPEAPGWTPSDRAMLQAVDELIAGARISDTTWAELGKSFDEQQLMDLVFTVGAYEVLAMALRTFGVELDDDLEEWK